MKNYMKASDHQNNMLLNKRGLFLSGVYFYQLGKFKTLKEANERLEIAAKNTRPETKKYFQDVIMKGKTYFFALVNI